MDFEASECGNERRMNNFLLWEAETTQARLGATVERGVHYYLR
jgi:hypothetical protein